MSVSGSDGESVILMVKAKEPPSPIPTSSVGRINLSFIGFEPIGG